MQDISSDVYQPSLNNSVSVINKKNA